MKGFLLSLAVILILVIPAVTLAQTDGNGIVPCDGPECQACHFVQLGQNLLVWFIKIMASVIAVVVAIAGLKMVTAGGDVGKVSEAKGMMTNALIGFVILLSAWLIIDTVMKLVANPNASAGGVKLGMWHTIECVAQPARTTTPTTTTTPGTVTTAPSTGGLSHTEAIAQLGGINVVSSGNCTDRTNRSCTSLEGFQPAALEKVKSVVSDCSGCNLQITAGTEVGHTNPCHVNGTCVDINCRGGCSNSQIVNIVNSAPSKGTRAVWEVKTDARRQELINQGVPANNIQVVSWITGEHASLYTAI